MKQILSNEQKSKDQYINTSDFLTSLEKNVINGLGFINVVYPDQVWLVDRLIPKDAITCISGAPKVGKSLFATNLAIAFVKGYSLFGQFDVVKSSVLYIGIDEPERLTNERFKKILGGEDIVDIALSSADEDLERFYFIGNLSISLDEDSVVEDLLLFCLQYQIDVIIIDSFRRIFSGDENESRTINKIQRAFKRFIDAKISVIFLHHHGKEGSNPRTNITEKLRGSSDILAMVDSLLMIEKVSEKRNKLVQAALRMDLPVQPFIYEHVSTSTDFRLVYIGELEPIKSILARISELVLDIVSKSQQPLRQKEIIEAVLKNDRDTSETTVKNALKSLVDAEFLYKWKDKTYSTQREGVTK